MFADKLTFPQGALWHDGSLYVASSGAIWRFRDKDDDGVADVRERIVSKFGYTGNAADVHGCFLGPDGRIYWCEGRHGHEIVDAAGEVLSKGKAARIFSCRPDGSDVQIHCGGGMDNPVEIDWTDAGEMLGTVNIMYQKRGDCLVHWMHGGVYPRHDQPAVPQRNSARAATRSTPSTTTATSPSAAAAGCAVGQVSNLSCSLSPWERAGVRFLLPSPLAGEGPGVRGRPRRDAKPSP